MLDILIHLGKNWLIVAERGAVLNHWGLTVFCIFGVKDICEYAKIHLFVVFDWKIVKVAISL